MADRKTVKILIDGQDKKGDTLKSVKYIPNFVAEESIDLFAISVQGTYDALHIIELQNKVDTCIAKVERASNGAYTFDQISDSYLAQDSEQNSEQNSLVIDWDDLPYDVREAYMAYLDVSAKEYDFELVAQQRKNDKAITDSKAIKCYCIAMFDMNVKIPLDGIDKVRETAIGYWEACGSKGEIMTKGQRTMFESFRGHCEYSLNRVFDLRKDETGIFKPISVSKIPEWILNQVASSIYGDSLTGRTKSGVFHTSKKDQPTIKALLKNFLLWKGCGEDKPVKIQQSHETMAW